jgi:hypothetical protein
MLAAVFFASMLMHVSCLRLTRAPFKIPENDALGSPRESLLSVSHGALLPASMARLIGIRNRKILSFVLSYLEQADAALDGVSVYSSGGFVRDLLVGRPSDDLDLALDLRGCAPSATVDSIIDGMPAFAAASGDDAIESVEVVTHLSVASRSKSIDAAMLSMDIHGDTVVVDFMPMIAHEIYDDEDRIPRREGHGTVWQDTLRRDLTANAMLLEVTRSTDAPDALSFRLQDFHGGLADLRAGVLRAPFPRDAIPHDIAASLGLSDTDLAHLSLPPNLSANCSLASKHEREEWLQVLWWTKALRDDPLRIVRTLRFAATLQFRVHGAFWRAVPLSLRALRLKVSGPRKIIELHKIAKAGRAELLDWFELAFSPLPASSTDFCLGDALFSGAPNESELRDADERALSVTLGFDACAMRAAAAALPEDLEADALLGAVLSAAIVACDLQQHNPCTVSVDDDLEEACLLAGPPCDGACDESPISDWQMAACLEISTTEVQRACDDLQASAQMVQAAIAPLKVASALLCQPAVHEADSLFAAAAGSAAGEAATAVGGRCGGVHGGGARVGLFGGSVSADEFASLLHLWERLKLEPSQTRRRLEVGSAYVLALLSTRCAPSTIDQLEAHVQLLSAPGPSIRGAAVVGMVAVPPRRRGELIARLHVLCCLRGETPELHTPEQLCDYLNVRGVVLDTLTAAWLGED